MKPMLDTGESGIGCGYTKESLLMLLGKTAKGAMMWKTNTFLGFWLWSQELFG